MACSLVLWGYYLSCEAIYTKGVSCGTRVGLAHCFGCVAFHMQMYVELRFGLDAVYFRLITPVVICTLECVGVCRCEVLSRLIGAIFGSWLDSMMKPYGLYDFTGTYLL